MNKIRQKTRKKMNRSGKSICPICKNEEFLEEHHLEGRDKDYSNKTFNKANICSNCHTRIHELDIVVEGWFMTSEGLQLLWHKQGDDSFTGKEIRLASR